MTSLKNQNSNIILRPNADDNSPAAKRIRERLDTWDHATPAERGPYMETFLSEFETRGDIERKLGYGASLFLARFLVWLQVSFLHGRQMGLTMKVLGLFVGSIDGARFTNEVVHGGLITTLLEIIAHPGFSTQEKIIAMELLAKIADKERDYREEICQTHGVKIVCEYIANYGCDDEEESHRATEEERTSRSQAQTKKYSQAVMGKAQKLLITISCDNPDYKMQITQVLIVLLTSVNPQAQLVACQVLLKILPHAMTMCGAAIDPLLGLLGCDNMWLLEKGIELMKLVIKSDHAEMLSKCLILLASTKCVSETDVTALYSSKDQQRQCDALFAIENLLDTSTLQHFLSLGLENALVMNISDKSSPDANQLSTKILGKIRTVKSAIPVKALDKKEPCSGDNICNSRTSSGIASRVDESGDNLKTSNKFTYLKKSDDQSKKITKVKKNAESAGDFQQALEPSQNLDENFSLSSDEEDAPVLPEDLDDFKYLSLDVATPKSVSEI